MSSTVLSQHSHTESKSRLFWQGTVAMLPLSVAVLPWGCWLGHSRLMPDSTRLKVRHCQPFCLPDRRNWLRPA